jgi:hypothetical protein
MDAIGNVLLDDDGRRAVDVEAIAVDSLSALGRETGRVECEPQPAIKITANTSERRRRSLTR